MANTVPLTVRMAPLPFGFSGTLQELGEAIAERLIIETSTSLSLFQSGPVAPTSNVGPWFKDDEGWYRWDAGTATYIPVTVDGSQAVAWSYGTDIFNADSAPFLCPTGALFPYCGTTTPTGWLLCDGDAVSRVTYARLFGVIGTQYGVGDASTTFNVPDLRGRVAISASPGSLSGNRNAVRVAAASGGEETHVLLEAELPAHTHDDLVMAASNGGGGGGANRVVIDSDNPAGDVTIINSITGSVGSDTAHENMPPFLVVNRWIIKT